MNRKIACLIIIVGLMLSIVPVTFAARTQTPRMVTDEIDARTPPPSIGNPDLSVTNIAFSPANPTSSTPVTITATIKNAGPGQSGNTQVQFFDSNALIGTTSIGRLKAAKSVTTSISYTFSDGTHNIKVVVDPDSQVTESDESNNDLPAVLQVGSGSPIHDIAITSVTPSKTVIPLNQPISITVQVANQGTKAETTTVTAYSNEAAIGSQPITLNSGYTGTLTFSWTATTTGTYTIKAIAATLPEETNTDNNQKTYGTVTVTNFLYILTIEIDYMPGHYPTDIVLDYMQNYYSGQQIQITYDIATSPVPLDTSVSTTDFWTIERQYNAGPDNTASNSYQYKLPNKWVLFGTTVQGQPNVVGYCYTTGTTADLLAGNYIYMADQTADTWAGSDPNIQAGAEATVLMHEIGHAIGIAILDLNGSEIYCADSTCVMSYLNKVNAANINNCHYCTAHWNTKDLVYYQV